MVENICLERISPHYALFSPPFSSPALSLALPLSRSRFRQNTGWPFVPIFSSDQSCRLAGRRSAILSMQAARHATLSTRRLDTSPWCLVFPSLSQSSYALRQHCDFQNKAHPKSKCLCSSLSPRDFRIGFIHFQKRDGPRGVEASRLATTRWVAALHRSGEGATEQWRDRDGRPSAQNTVELGGQGSVDIVNQPQIPNRTTFRTKSSAVATNLGSILLHSHGGTTRQPPWGLCRSAASFG
jgi:hypothetical protein